ncbi:glutamine synthetase [candidate division WOR-1 bacterium RIFOXYA12_FULL_43_27]|uniref:Glutamine synthetase n=1 Tax=candidate division WOR-1 bacterium RIFOXYC2_FULL_46_14 TaxID=1802587 RepID=A0A1F4U7S1_UNCSA|nr:MAG: glutamine synthetase [candidate division WOR-1 bacterium RIFOXYA12_FULL_43_27]OGC19352.1 MAG: glutamine synthetase [candidate division WOR-1 bacterium RIFOXYB2_FULL_46_45]OGC30341.1 MAG: glutamine synthetase [candidate division WOR-1 bacterium RIFOXYA2_FULL_46_56]OGC40942.1 MAG: glutamine synthetase [candidate division WOR-1 bacterium RIFOXYC2_FULL_46_14]
MPSKEEIMKLVADNDVEFIRLWFTDVNGILKSFSIGKEELEGALTDGMGFDGSSITGFQDIEESDMIAMPDPNTFQILPWRPQEKAVARMICDILQPGGKPYEGDPRYILKRALKKMAKMGFDHMYVGPELEYFYFKDSKGTEILDEGGYFDLTPLDMASNLRRDTVLALRKLGINVEYSHHEVAPSQHEIDMRYDDALKMADDMVTYRLTVKEVASANGVYATFMPKPMFGQNGSGMHCHQSLFKGSSNAFYDAKDKYHLSATGKSYIAGILKFAPEMISVLAPWVNSYKRLVPGYEAPVYIAWSRRNRSALIRVPMYKPGAEKATRMELRCPDPSGNPYLQLAVMLSAGLKGIEEEYKLQEPMELNLYHLTDEERAERGIQSLPASLGQAIEIAEKSDFLRETLGDHTFNRFIELKKKEWDEFRIQVTEYEIKKYLPIL